MRRPNFSHRHDRVQLWYCARRSLAGGPRAFARWRARESRRFRQEARRSAKQLGAQHQTFAKPLSELMLAGVAISVGDPARARLHLQASIEQFDREGMRLYAAAARVRLGEISPGDGGAELVRTGVAAFEAEGVASVSRCVDMLAPLPRTPRQPAPRSCVINSVGSHLPQAVSACGHSTDRNE